MNSEMINIVNLIIIIYALIVCTDTLKENKVGLRIFVVISVLISIVCKIKFKLDIDIFIIVSVISISFCLILPFLIGIYIKYKEINNKQIENTKRFFNLIINITIIINKLILIFGIIVLTHKLITLISNKANLSTDIVTLITVIVALLTAVYTTMKSNKSDLSAESLWREELMNVASKEKIGKEDLLRLRASQRYSYAKKKADHTTKEDSNKNKDSSNNIGDEVRNKIGHMTNELYIRCILNGKKLSKKDVNTIRNLAIALLKYDYIKRGDNVKLTHYIIRELEEDDEYSNLLNWINKEIDVDKYKI